MELKRGVLTPPLIDPVLIGDVKFSSGHPSWIVTRFLETESPLTFNTDTHITDDICGVNFLHLSSKEYFIEYRWICGGKNFLTSVF